MCPVAQELSGYAQQKPTRNNLSLLNVLAPKQVQWARHLPLYFNWWTSLHLEVATMNDNDSAGRPLGEVVGRFFGHVKELQPCTKLKWPLSLNPDFRRSIPWRI